MAQRVLVVDDEPDLTQVLEYNLKNAGYDVSVALRGQAALSIMRESPIDLVLLDLMMPEMPGTEVCRHIKSDPALSKVPVIMLTAKGEEIDRVVGFELGCDDYVVKPFSVRELLLRVQAILRRDRLPPPRPEGEAVFGVLRVDTAAHRVWVEDQEVALTALELKLLLLLWERKNRVQSRAALLTDVWGVTADINTRTVDTHVKRLREKLGRAGDYVETVRGVGYRFADAPQ